MFLLGAGESFKAQGYCLVYSETLVSLARDQGGGVVEWDAWEKFTISPDIDELSAFRMYSVSGSRFVMVDINEVGRWAKIRVYDLTHWSRQQPGAGLGGGAKTDGKKVSRYVTETVLELPDGMWSICHAPMVQDSMVFFHVSPPAR